jgi:hypothetical protein
MRFLTKPFKPGERLPEEQVGKMLNVGEGPERPGERPALG